MGFLVVIILALLVLLFSCIRIVPQAQCYVIEFLGSYKVTWENGLHFKIPLLERIAKRVSMKEQVADFPPQPVITKDNVTMQIDTVVYYNIFNPKLFTYGVEQPILALANITATTLRNIIGEMELDETLTSRDIINDKMQVILDKATDPWGIKVNRVELKNIIPPREIQDAMEKQMKAERERRQTLLEAQGHKEAVTLRAQGDKEAKILKAEAERDSAIAIAEGKAKSIKLVYEAEAEGIRQLNEAKMSENVLTLKKLDAFKAVADGRATKIIVPSELAETASKLQFAAEILGTSETSVDKSPKVTPEEIVEDPCCDNSEKYE